MKKALLYEILRILGGLILGFVLLVAGSIYFISSKLCDEELVGTYKSPNGVHEAVYNATRCGAISEDVGHVILDGKEVVRARLGNLTIAWKDNETLHVEYSGINVSKPIREYKGVTIDFLDVTEKLRK